jgi:hypothetical protein
MAQPKLIIGGRRYRWEKSDNPVDAQQIAKQTFVDNYYKPEGENLNKYVGWINQNPGYVPVYEGEAYSMPQIQKEMAARQQSQAQQPSPTAKSALDIIDNFRANAASFGIDDDYSVGTEQLTPYQQPQPQSIIDVEQDNFFAQNNLLKKKRQPQKNNNNFADAFLGAYNASRENYLVPRLRQYRDYGY